MYLSVQYIFQFHQKCYKLYLQSRTPKNTGDIEIETDMLLNGVHNSLSLLHFESASVYDWLVHTALTHRCKALCISGY